MLLFLSFVFVINYLYRKGGVQPEEVTSADLGSNVKYFINLKISTLGQCKYS